MMGDMDHDEVRDILADAAIEPGGLERLMAGDTPTAAIVAGHLAGCADCADELERLRRSVGVIRPIVRAVPPPELRGRTLAYVAALGRPRGVAIAAATATAPATHAAAALAEAARAAAPTPAFRPASPPAARSTARRSVPRRLPVLAGLAAAILVAVAGTGLIVSVSRDAELRQQAAKLEALGDVARWTLRVDAQPDARRVQLAGASGGATTGTLVFSPSTTELVVVAEQLTPPQAGYDYRCWVEVGGKRESVGKMFFGGDLAYWVGDVPEVSGLPSGAQFGVSLVDLSGSGQPGEPVLVGTG
jgi:Anti-sigma-K factor rskA